ncbi:MULTISPECIES: alpha/beta hydrolase [unclassified Sphingomonas]|uniref:alpha/beta hydrolase n=1 Tax=unclassified Sphingomonas TaxID=196159 RepID=UPI000AD35E27|nr:MULTISPECIES: alpha/beta hydrolase [unclassified Sphingomonas]
MLQRETAACAARRRAALAGLAAYQAAPRVARAPAGREIARCGRVSVRDHGGAAASGRPVLLVPSLINAPFILDLSPGRSLVAWLAARGLRAMLVDWGTPDPAEREEDISAHVADRLVPLIDAVTKDAGAEPLLVGYCLGGTMAIAAAALRPVAALALIAAPWHYSGFGEPARAQIGRLWAQTQPVCDALGLVPMEVLQACFWQLDPARTIAKYERFATLDPDDAAARDFVVLEDWANGGAPLTYGAGAQMFEQFFAADTPGRGAWQVAGTPVDPHAIDIPTIEFVARNDRIVPAASALGRGEVRPLDAGHVGMVVGQRARDQLWAPLADWLSGIALAR